MPTAKPATAPSATQAPTPISLMPRNHLRRHQDATEGLPALDVGVCGGGLCERECPADLDAHLAARDPLEQVRDQSVDARILGQQPPAEEDAAQRVVLRP